MGKLPPKPNIILVWPPFLHMAQNSKKNTHEIYPRAHSLKKIRQQVNNLQFFDHSSKHRKTKKPQTPTTPQFPPLPSKTSIHLQILFQLPWLTSEDKVNIFFLFLLFVLLNSFSFMIIKVLVLIRVFSN